MTSQRQTDTAIYFWGGQFSNFYQLSWTLRERSPLFRQSLWQDGPLLDFNSSEQYLMAAKAAMFGNVIGTTIRGVYNPSVLERVLVEKTPKAQKALGRQVEGFDKVRWEMDARDILCRALWAKFTQNTDLMAALIETGDRILVEGSPFDAIWGVALAWDNPAIENPANWRGSNWLGECLMRVRDWLHLYAEGEEPPIWGGPHRRPDPQIVAITSKPQ